jgi:hypothetical protein
MFQKTSSQDPFFNMKALAPRPMSQATDIFDTDFEDDDDNSIIMDIDEEYSPGVSANSVSSSVLTTKWERETDSIATGWPEIPNHAL